MAGAALADDDDAGGQTFQSTHTYTDSILTFGFIVGSNFPVPNSAIDDEEEQSNLVIN